MAEKHLKKGSTSLVIMEMQIKTTPRFHLTPVRMAKIKTSGSEGTGEDGEEEEYPSTAGVIASWYNHSGNQFGGSSEKMAIVLSDDPAISWAYTQKSLNM